MDKSVFSGWEIVEKLGAGAFSTVYKIRKEDGLGGEYFSALKVISIPNSEDEYKQYRDEGFDDESISKLFEQQMQSVTSEFKLLSTFKGAPNIVTFEDYKVQQQEDGIGWTAYIKMELLTALPDAYKAQPLTVEDTVKLGTDIAGALMLCEQKNIIHRDIKPQNIFVSEFGDYKLGDFGIARNMDHTTRATKIGTPAYMAPEVYRGDSYGPNVDIYSLGMVLYWLLNERRMPFLPLPPQMPTAEQTSAAHTKRLSGAPLPPPKNGTDALKQAVLKACAFDPKQRYATAKEFKAALAASLAAPVVHTAPTAPIAQDIEATVAVRKAPPAQDIEKTTAVRKAPAELAQQVYITPTAVEKTKKPNEEKNRLKKAVLLELWVVIFLSALFFFFPPIGGCLSNGVKWQIRNDTLTVSGKGEFDGDWRFENPSCWDVKEEFKNVVIKDGVTSIGTQAFDSCGALTSISIPDSVTSIGVSAFLGCDALTSISIPDSVTSIGDAAFNGCNSLTSVIIPNSVTSIGDWAFIDCVSLTSISIPDSVTSIGTQAFAGCDALTSISIPDSVTSIGFLAFENCDALTSISIPDSVTSIATGAFQRCDSLTSVNYSGTMAQWEEVNLSIYWKADSPFTKVHCTDGNVKA